MSENIYVALLVGKSSVPVGKFLVNVEEMVRDGMFTVNQKYVCGKKKIHYEEHPASVIKEKGL